MMSTLISQILIGLGIIVIIGIILLFVMRKRKDTTHFQSKIVNDTNYNIAGMEENKAQADPKEVKKYLDRKQNEGDQPLSRGDYEAYNDKV